MYKNLSEINISIGLGVYNEEKLISRMIESILNQSHKNFELIISDDCSPIILTIYARNLRYKIVELNCIHKI